MSPSVRGFTLLEMLIGLLLGLLTLAAVTALVASGARAWREAGARVEALAAATAALDCMVRDIRLAGYDPEARGDAGIAEAETSRITLLADLDGDGRIDGRSAERVTYRPSSGGLARVVGRQSMLVLSDLAGDGLRLRYFDAAGVELDPGRSRTAAEARLVTVELRTLGTPRHGPLHVVGGARLLNR